MSELVPADPAGQSGGGFTPLVPFGTPPPWAIEPDLPDRPPVPSEVLRVAGIAIELVHRHGWMMAAFEYLSRLGQAGRTGRTAAERASEAFDAYHDSYFSLASMYYCSLVPWWVSRPPAFAERASSVLEWIISRGAWAVAARSVLKPAGMPVVAELAAVLGPRLDPAEVVGPLRVECRELAARPPGDWLAIPGGDGDDDTAYWRHHTDLLFRLPPDWEDLDDGARLALVRAGLPGRPAAQPVPAAGGFEHTAAFRRVRWAGVEYGFTRSQAMIVAELHRRFQGGVPGATADELKKACGSQAGDWSVSRAFRAGVEPHPAWTAGLIRSDDGKPALYRLAIGAG